MSAVALVYVPFGAVERPSMALGLLQAILRRDGIATTTFYANLDFAEAVGTNWTVFLESALGDLAFTPAAFPGFRPDDRELLRRRVTENLHLAERAGLPTEPQRLLADIGQLRGWLEGFFRRLARRVVGGGFAIVGSSSTYAQHTASLALLRAVKELSPGTVTMMGGANCETTMGWATHKNFSQVDFVVSGEADDLIGPLCSGILKDGPDLPAERLPPGVFGPVHRPDAYPRTGGPDGLPRASCRDVSALPTPDYDDYFRHLEQSALATQITVGLPLETARGCWWGEKRQCKFCGISEAGMVYRSKAPDRVVNEFDALERRYGVARFNVVDNILDVRYLKSVIPRLVEKGERREIFWELKANVRREQLALLRQAGVTWAQPGIEALDDRLLSLMDKGVTAIQNLRLLRWCRELGIRLSWNLICAFPGERDEWYAETARLVPLLHHLQPPRVMLALRYDRFGVYHRQAEGMGLELTAAPSWAMTYPLDPEDLDALAWWFVPRAAGDQPAADRPGLRRMARAVEAWSSRFWTGVPPVLSVQDDGDRLRVFDTRACAGEPHAEIGGLTRSVYRACDGGCSPDRLPALLERTLGRPVNAERLESELRELRQRSLVALVGGQLLNLGVEGPIPTLPSAARFPGGFVRHQGTPRPPQPVGRAATTGSGLAAAASGPV